MKRVKFNRETIKVNLDTTNMDDFKDKLVQGNVGRPQVTKKIIGEESTNGEKDL
jgi:hypothetical protein